ncbi:uncharacterized protein C3orf22 homolog [Macrotis lagotis]|uniref:uncharacterized protein C3orf22 homolog n=1 Tax=Macrotis lagotis TaxID=92651 RepID=UPI003D695800
MEAEGQRSEFSERNKFSQKFVHKQKVVDFHFKEDQIKKVMKQHKDCDRPINVRLYPGILGHENSSFCSLGQILTNDKSKKEEIIEPFAINFPYRLAWLTVNTEMSRTKPWEKKKMLGHLREKLPLQKGLQPTWSIPSKGNHVLVTSMMPPSRATYIPPLRNRMEDRLLSSRFPKQKARLQELLGYHMYGWLRGQSLAPGSQGKHLVVEFNSINFPPSTTSS